MSIALQIQASEASVVDVSQTVADVEKELRQTGAQLAVVCDDELYLGVVSLAELANYGAKSAKNAAKAMYALFPLATPFVPESSSPFAIRRFLRENDLAAVPFTDRRGKLTRLLSPEQALQTGLYENAAVTMAGGYGMRLRPITENIPKPMIPLVDGKLLDRILDHLLDCGIYRHYVAVHYLKEQVMDYLGDGNGWGISVEYIEEDSPQGTAGSLRTLQTKETVPILVNNGDIITNQRYGEILRFHNREKCEITVVCKQAGVDISYGVVKCNTDGSLKSISEKPRLSYLINTGIYVINPDILNLVPEGPCYMTDLIDLVKEKGGKVGVFQTKEYWRDIGTIDCYAQVMKDIRTGLVRSFDRGNGVGNGRLSSALQMRAGNGQAG